MNPAYVFWTTSFYTLWIFVLQVYELLTGQEPFNFVAINAGYLGLMSVYVGGKELKRWRTSDAPTPPSPDAPSPWRLPGEFFVSLWLLFFLSASAMVQFRPDTFHYPSGLNTIALEVLTFYLGSSVSKWLKVKDDRVKGEVEEALSAGGKPDPEDGSAESKAKIARVSKKRNAYEEKVVALAQKQGSVTREDVEKLTGLKGTSAGVLLSGLVDRGVLQRRGEPGSKETRYEPSAAAI